MKNIFCPHFILCSGCTLNENVDRPPVAKQLEDFFKQRNLPIPFIYSDEVNGWRCRAKLSVRGTPQEPLIGLYKKSSHDVLEIPFCQVHHPNINKAVEVIKNSIIKEKITPYNEKTFSGLLRYLQLVVERKTGRIQLSLVLNEPPSKEKMFWIEKLWDAGKESLWHSIWVNINTTRANVIFGNQWELCFGESLVWEKFNSTEVCFHPGSFAQANLTLFEKMLFRINERIPPHLRIVEYYAGVGVIGLTLVEKSLQVICCEINPLAKQCFEQAKAKLSVLNAEKITFEEGSAEKRLDLLHEADLVIVDPPRKGLDVALRDALNIAPVKRLVYVSCGWESFQKDCDLLLQGGWKLVEVEAYLFFPGTNHLELLAFFEKVV